MFPVYKSTSSNVFCRKVTPGPASNTMPIFILHQCLLPTAQKLRVYILLYDLLLFLLLKNVCNDNERRVEQGGCIINLLNLQVEQPRNSIQRTRHTECWQHILPRARTMLIFNQVPGIRGSWETTNEDWLTAHWKSSCPQADRRSQQLTYTGHPEATQANNTE